MRSGGDGERSDRTDERYAVYHENVVIGHTTREASPVTWLFAEASW